MYKLVLIRHGESTWNLENRFTGWTDVDLTPTGVSQAMSAGSCSRPKAGTSTCATPGAQARHPHPVVHARRDDRTWLLVVRTTASTSATTAVCRLNKADMAKQYGDEQVLIWRRSYDTPPPALEADDPRGQRQDRRYANLAPEQIPLTECLSDTVARVVPYWNETIAPSIKSGQRVLIAAHGNSIRALIKAPRRHLGRRHRQPQHPQRHPAGVRVRRPQAAALLLPGDAGGRGSSRCRRNSQGQGLIRQWDLTRAGCVRCAHALYCSGGTHERPTEGSSDGSETQDRGWVAIGAVAGA